MQAENSKVKMRSQETQTQASFLPCIIFEGFQASPQDADLSTHSTSLRFEKGT